MSSLNAHNRDYASWKIHTPNIYWQFLIYQTPLHTNTLFSNSVLHNLWKEGLITFEEYHENFHNVFVLCEIYSHGSEYKWVISC